MRDFKKEYGPFGLPEPPSSDSPDGDQSAGAGKGETKRRFYFKNEYYDTLESYKDYAKSGYLDSREAVAAPRLNASFCGVLVAGQTTRGISSRFIDELISAYPEEAFVHTRAVGRKRIIIPRFEEAVSAYILSVGPFRNKNVSIRINVPFVKRGIVREIHNKVFERLMFCSDKSEEWKAPETVLKEIQREYNDHSAPASQKPLIELLF